MAIQVGDFLLAVLKGKQDRDVAYVAEVKSKYSNSKGGALSFDVLFLRYSKASKSFWYPKKEDPGIVEAAQIR